MNNKQTSALKQFHASIEALRDAGIIRSHRYLGDIGEFLCATKYNIKLADNRRERFYDGRRESVLVQIKYHGGKSTTVNLGDPNSYGEVYLVLGPESGFRPQAEMAEFLIYRWDSAKVREIPTTSGKRNMTKERLSNLTPDRINLADFEEIE